MWVVAGDLGIHDTAEAEDVKVSAKGLLRWRTRLTPEFHLVLAHFPKPSIERPVTPELVPHNREQSRRREAPQGSGLTRPPWADPSSQLATQTG